MHSQNMIGNTSIMLRCQIVQHNEEQIETRQQRIGQANVFVWSLLTIVLSVDWIRSCCHTTTSIQRTVNACFCNRHSLLFHHFMNSNTIINRHFIEFIDTIVLFFLKKRKKEEKKKEDRKVRKKQRKKETRKKGRKEERRNRKIKIKYKKERFTKQCHDRPKPLHQLPNDVHQFQNHSLQQQSNQLQKIHDHFKLNRHENFRLFRFFTHQHE